MSLDLPSFAAKIRRCRDLFDETPESLATATGIALASVRDLESASRPPTGDEVLILADHFKLDFKFFISNEELTPIERTEKLFRSFSADLSADDRWAIQEFLFLCENEAHLLALLERPKPNVFTFVTRGDYYKGHGCEAADRLRSHLGYSSNAVCDVFGDMRRLGFRVFRRKLENSNISGIFLNHPVAGPCILVNYTEDVYRQRFTVAHEGAHAIFDIGDDFSVSFQEWKGKDLREVRANAFAGCYLVPPSLTQALNSQSWDERRVLSVCDQLKVNVPVLVNALERDGVLSKAEAGTYRSVRLPKGSKEDPDLPKSLSPNSLERRRMLLERGFSTYYVDLCFEAYQLHAISVARLAEMLLVDSPELGPLADLFGVKGV